MCVCLFLIVGASLCISMLSNGVFYESLIMCVYCFEFSVQFSNPAYIFNFYSYQEVVFLLSVVVDRFLISPFSLG